MYLDDVSRLLGVLLEEQHAGSEGVNVELLQELSDVRAALLHIPKPHIISEGERC